jgi:NDP-sugar pyrophosphorylase family protein
LGDHETETFPRLAQAGRLAAMRSRSFWRSVDSFKDLSEAEDHVASR